MVKVLNTTPLPLRILGGSIKYFETPTLKLKIINCKVFNLKLAILKLATIFGGGLKTETGNNILGGSIN